MGTNAKLTIKQRLENFKAMEKEDKRRWWGEFFIDNSLYIFLIAAIIGIAVYNPNFVSMKSIINIVSLSAANLHCAGHRGRDHSDRHRPFGRARCGPDGLRGGFAAADGGVPQ